MNDAGIDNKDSDDDDDDDYFRTIVGCHEKEAEICRT